MSNERIDFDGQKPVALIERILQLSDADKNSIVLDSFAGSGTTAHAVINLNAADGGTRKFILIELNDYAETITAERVRRVGGEFNFYELGEQLFDEDGFINENVSQEKIFEYIYFSETRKKYQPCEEENLIGTDDDTAYYYFKELSWTTLAQIKTRAKNYVIYAESCCLSEYELMKYKITFKQIPFDIRKY
jgi:adenine-specific DNA-methyltransferase